METLKLTKESILKDHLTTPPEQKVAAVNSIGYKIHVQQLNEWVQKKTARGEVVEFPKIEE